MPASPPQGRGIDRLLAVMAQLRATTGGCPWDVEQSFATIAPYTIEEAYEVAEAIEKQDMAALKDKLGDLLFQVVFHSRMAEEQATFDFDAVAGHCADKMVRRHPHVFGARADIATAADQSAAWEEVKAAERAARAAGGALDGVTPALPALTRAMKIQNRAARVGFDWTSAPPILDKIAEELDELRVEIESEASVERLDEEFGDFLFAAANLARRLGLDAEGSLRRATLKFERRFRRMEALAGTAGDRLETHSLDGLEALWQQVKQGGC